MRAILIAAAFCLAGAGAIAATPEEPVAPAQDLAFDAPQWRALVEGKTLYYRNRNGEFVGREYYAPGSQRAVFIYFDGSCYDGTWREDDGVFEFRYDGVFYFRHLRRGGELIAAEVDGPEQVVFKITNEVLSCSDDLIS